MNPTNQDKNSDFLKYSDRIDALRSSLRMTKGELADHLGVNRQHLSAWINGKSPLTVKAWRKLEEAEARLGILPPEAQLTDLEKKAHELVETNKADLADRYAWPRRLRAEGEQLISMAEALEAHIDALGSSAPIDLTQIKLPN